VRSLLFPVRHTGNRASSGLPNLCGDERNAAGRGARGWPESPDSLQRSLLPGKLHRIADGRRRGRRKALIEGESRRVWRGPTGLRRRIDAHCRSVMGAPGSRRQLPRLGGGERGIRTLDRLSPIHAFQACAFNHSATSPPLSGSAEYSDGVACHKRACAPVKRGRRLEAPAHWEWHGEG
jgi:hypothetical protein